MHALSHFPFEVNYSDGADQTAREIAARTDRARGWMTELLGFTPHLTLEVLEPVDWAERAQQPMYGMPHFGDDGTIYVAATYADLFSDLVDLTVEDMPDEQRATFHAVYGNPPLVRPFVDLLSLHELAHLYHAQAGFDFGRWWLNELYCNIALEGYIAEVEPATLPALETFPLAAGQIRPERMSHVAIDEMAEARGVNYGWYELRLHAAAIGIWQVGGRGLLKHFYNQAAAATRAGRALMLGEVDLVINQVALDWPSAASS